MPFPTYQFRAVTTADLPLLRDWLWRTHVREWWGDPVRGLAAIAEHIVDPAIDPFMAEFDDVPIGYIQSWDPHAEADHPCRDQPLGTRGIDQFIGEPKLIGQGHGTSPLCRELVQARRATGHHRSQPTQFTRDPCLCQGWFQGDRPPHNDLWRSAPDGPQRLAI